MIEDERLDHEEDSLGLLHDPRALDEPLNAAAVCEKRSNRAAVRDRHELAAAYAQAAALYLIVAELQSLSDRSR